MPVYAPRTPLSPAQLRTRAGVIVVALAGEHMLLHAEASAPHTFFEFRLDSLSNPAAFVATLKPWLAERPWVTAIATCRRTAFGGSFAGSAREQVAILTRAAEAGCQLVDIEVETAEELGREALTALHAAAAAVILSWHDFVGTPDLEAVFDRLSAYRPDFCKIVPFATSLRDSLRLLDLLEAHGTDGRLIAMSMGMRGVLTRVMGPRYGSAFTFAAPDTAEGTAPGQMALSTLRDSYRLPDLSTATSVYAVAGDPIGASLSPCMHNAAFRAAGLDAVYVPLETNEVDELRDVANRLQLRGVSVTMPLKEAVLSLLAVRSTAVQQMRACNTLLRQTDGTWHGDNTDVAGIVDPLNERMQLTGKRVLVLGAGGAARAAVFGLRHCGAEVYILNRTEGRAIELAAEAGAHVQPTNAPLNASFDIIINSTPYGMRGKTAEAPLSRQAMVCSLLFDLVYNPQETPLIHLAHERGIATIPGSAMFVAQGVAQFELWTGLQAPHEAMLQAVTNALDARE